MDTNPSSALARRRIRVATRIAVVALLIEYLPFLILGIVAYDQFGQFGRDLFYYFALLGALAIAIVFLAGQLLTHSCLFRLFDFN